IDGSRRAEARLIRGIATAAIMLLTIPPITDVAEAGPGGGGGKGGGFGGHVGVGARAFAGRGGGSGFVGGARIGGRGIGSLGTSHFFPRGLFAAPGRAAEPPPSLHHPSRTL